jgi:FkbM family methyltransferase
MASEGNFISEFVIPMFPKGSIGVCLDIGAYDPEWINNSIELEELGWTCYCIEPNPHCIPALKAKRKHVLEYAIGDVNEDDISLYVFHLDTGIAGPLGEASGTGLLFRPEEMTKYETTLEKVKVRTFEWLMENEVHEEHIDVISIDVEGSEMAILSTLDVSRWRPKVIICENIGESKDQHDWFERMGFGRIKRVAFNDIYVRLSEIQLKVGK